MPKKKSAAKSKETQMRWSFGPHIPTHDFFEMGSLNDMGNLEEAVDNFVYRLEGGRFLTWEAIVCEEQGIELTPRQKKELASLLNFSDDEDNDPILYINEIARPSEPWHVILNKIIPYLLTEPYRTNESHWDVQCDGWSQIMTALHEHGQDLSLPPDVESVDEVVPVDLRHKLWLQLCFNALDGLGQEGVRGLDHPESHFRIEWFIDRLVQHKESVAYLALTLESLVAKVILPERDRPIFLKMMQDQLGLSSAQEPIADYL